MDEVCYKICNADTASWRGVRRAFLPGAGDVIITWLSAFYGQQRQFLKIGA